MEMTVSGRANSTEHLSQRTNLPRPLAIYCLSLAACLVRLMTGPLMAWTRCHPRQSTPAVVVTVLATLLTFVSTPATVWGHASAEDYVWLSIESNRIEGKFEVNFEDLDRLGIEATTTQLSSIDFAATHAPKVHEYIKPRFSIGDDDGPYTIEFGESRVEKLPEGRFLALDFVARPATGEVADLLNVEHQMFTDENRLHRGLVLIKSNARLNKTYDEKTTLVFASHSSQQQLDLNNPPRLLTPMQFVQQGVVHILFGFDHVLFLITLLLVSVLRPGAVTDPDTQGGRQRWLPVQGFREAFMNIVGIVTTFTIAHSVTLGLAATGLVQLPAHVVEPIIALSIVILALANFLPTRRIHRIGLIFFFGLFHGLGFAAVMGVLAFRVTDIKAFLLEVILTFNIGVELGQLLLVALIFPLLYLIRKSRLYVPLMVQTMSVAVALMGLWWIFERTGVLTTIFPDAAA